MLQGLWRIATLPIRTVAAALEAQRLRRATSRRLRSLAAQQPRRLPSVAEWAEVD